MKSIIFKSASTYLLPLLVLFSVFILLRGHYLPGGGFVGGLIASIAFVIHSFANGLETTKSLIKFHPGFLMPIGLSIALLSGMVPLLIGESFMTGLWFDEPLPVIGMIGTALFFDTGVYLVVIGVTLTIIFTISETI
ncbi:multicomponent Na+:H+ antiporter subunit B [Algoriphagus sp. 4150]|uniref:Na+/H+ antiporter subunit B n=1 Tax=Algoriphagus sp. 4150 TaxID=2817756 RepID=UPI002866694A|nr:Na+/H+ antiporter subunit B [Algoriphagus sp. 4150]MDR7127879.1 multicomponent Na+:H+ antiporter subunit B [Algoriphagus sp. 4150]